MKRTVWTQPQQSTEHGKVGWVVGGGRCMCFSGEGRRKEEGKKGKGIFVIILK